MTLNSGNFVSKKDTAPFLGDSLSDVKTLPSGDVGGPVFGESTMLRRRSVYPVCFGLLFGVLGLCLIGLMVLREVQLMEMKKEVVKLRIDVDRLTYMAGDDALMDQLMKFKNEMNAKKDNEVSISKLDDDADDTKDDDEDDGDDDDMYGYGSGSYGLDDSYSDDADFLGDIQEASINIQDGLINIDGPPKLHKVMRVLKAKANDQKERKKDRRERRAVVEETVDGVPVFEESYRELRTKNLSDDKRYQHYTPSPRMIMDWDNAVTTRRPHHSFHSSSSLPMVQRPSLIQQIPHLEQVDAGSGGSIGDGSISDNNDFRRVIKFRRPELRSGGQAEQKIAYLERSEEVVTRPHRRRKNRLQMQHLGSGDGAPSTLVRHNMPLVHYQGDTAHYVMGEHPHYAGNGRLRHPHDSPFTAWSAPSWLSLTTQTEQFTLRDGGAVVPENGIYFVYAQIFYHDRHQVNSFKVYRSTSATDETLLQCTLTSAPTPGDDQDISNTCYTAGLVHLMKGDQVFVKNLGSVRFSIMQKAKSYFGMFKVADTKQNHL